MPELLPLFEQHFKTYINATFVEPFTGSAVVATNVDAKNKIINDINPDLTNFYNIIKNYTDNFILEAKTLFTPDNCNVANYNKFRNEFNNNKTDDVRSAALFLYLNKHCFNGLCRYNQKGKFNVPPHSCCKAVGPAPSLPLKEIYEMRDGLENCAISNCNFLEIMQKAKPGDLIYCDPPYFAFENSSSFMSYSKDGFSLCNQIELAYEAKRQACDGVCVVISNAATPTCVQLYKELGAKVRYLEVIRSVGANTRGTAQELIAVFN